MATPFPPPPAAWSTLFVLAATLAGPGPAPAQQARPFPVATPVLEHHEAPTTLATVATVGGAMGVSALVYLRPDASGWERSGTLAFTTPFAAVGTVLGLVVAVSAGGGDGDTAGRGVWLMPLTGVAVGVLGGGLGHQAGLKAGEGVQSSRQLIRFMWGVSVPAAVFTGLFYFAVTAES